MKLDKSRSTIRALALLLVASTLTTCGDDSSSSKEDRGVFGEMADALAQSEADFLTANAEVFASAEYIQPYIIDLLNSTAQSATSAMASTSCLPEGVGGRTYTINGMPFTSVEDSLVPEYTARFRLFKLSNTGAPQLNQEIGYIDCGCRGIGVREAEIGIFSDTGMVASVAFLEYSGAVTGVIRNSTGTTSLPFEGSLGHFGLNMAFIIPEGSTEFYSAPLLPAATMPVRAYIVLQHSELDIHLNADQYGEVVTGHAVYAGSAGRFLAACTVSGTLNLPDFTMPSMNCYTDSVDLMPVSNAKLDAMSDSYRPLRAFWLTTVNLVEICRSIVPANHN